MTIGILTSFRTPDANYIDVYGPSEPLTLTPHRPAQVFCKLCCDTIHSKRQNRLHRREKISGMNSRHYFASPHLVKTPAWSNSDNKKNKNKGLGSSSGSTMSSRSIDPNQAGSAPLSDGRTGSLSFMFAILHAEPEPRILDKLLLVL